MTSSAFERFHPDVQKWIWKQGWRGLRDVQERAADPIFSSDRDVLISAATAAGKTEAAFLPIYSLLAEKNPAGIGALYISPLKALINDQRRRQLSLSEITGVPVTPWHGDAAQSGKQKLRRDPRGVLLITPESLESLVMNYGAWCVEAFSHLSHVVIDEFHALIGSERGMQLQSLLRRLEFLLGRQIPRVALSATLGDMDSVANALRLNQNYPCEVVIDDTVGSDLKLQLRGYPDPVGEDAIPAMSRITEDLYQLLRGSSNLVFANSRSRTELIAADLSERCQKSHVPNEFFPHHGSLGKELREALEKRLQQEQLPTSAICTMTLELGIDIGHVDSVAQVTSPNSVASLRQRLGRSGRRSEASILRLFIPEAELTQRSPLGDRLRLQLVQSIAMVNLLLRKWYEPPGTDLYHYSTLVQQILSVLAQYGGVRAQQLWKLLCDTGPFYLVDAEQFGELLRELGRQEMITQTNDGQIVLGHRGELYTEHYTFYAAFNTPEEFVLEAEGHVLGTLPIDKPLLPEQMVIFGGRRWQVVSISAEKKRIQLKPAKGGQPPKFGGEGMQVHRIVREEMYRVYRQAEVPIYLDTTAKELCHEAFETFVQMKMGERSIFAAGAGVQLVTWLGDRENNVLVQLLREHGIVASTFAGLIDANDCSVDQVVDALCTMLENPPTVEEMGQQVPVVMTLIDKHDIFVPDSLRQLGYARRMFDIDGALEWISSAVEECR